MSKRSDIGAKLTELVEKVRARRDHFFVFFGKSQHFEPPLNSEYTFFPKIKKILSDNVFMMVHVEKI